MFVKVLKSKLHRATVTDVKVDYPGSLLIDSALMEAADIVPYESVLVADLNNGNRFETYVIGAKAHSGEVIVLGAAAKLVERGDIIIILGFAYCTAEDARKLKPRIIILDENNRPKKTV